MRNSLLFFILSSFFFNCTSPTPRANKKLVSEIVPAEKDTFHLLCQYWQLDDADNPTPKDISFSDNGIQLQSGITFMTDSIVLENPRGEMTYGKFKINGNTINVNFDNGTNAVYKIGKINEEDLLLKRTENKKSSELTYKATHTYWPDAGKDPFSKQNYQWAIKPKKSETAAEIKNRAKQCVQFYVYYFDGFVAGGATTVSFDALPNCFNWYVGGITIQSEKKLDKKWINSFYSKEEAFQARQMLEDALMKKYDWDTTQTNWLKQTALVLQQIHDGM